MTRFSKLTLIDGKPIETDVRDDQAKRHDAVSARHHGRRALP